ncbi:unnamed protein product [Durusdinium trenchii]|uniref:Uncharacterized protein n=1 Tax=Durusdinium trenchii TaxID=1381693 RepID=A0ABP0RNH7_9DINO
MPHWSRWKPLGWMTMKWIRSLFLEECRSPECVEMELNVVHMRCLGKAWLPSLRGWGDTRRGGKPCFSLWGLGTKEGPSTCSQLDRAVDVAEATLKTA